MEALVGMFVFLGLVAIVIEVLKRQGVLPIGGAPKGRAASGEVVGRGAPPFQRKKYLLTPNEAEFYRALKRAVGDSAEIFVQVPILSLVLPVRGGSDRSTRTSWRNRIDRKTVDFVVCEPGTLVLLAAIELDDRTHARENRVARDGLVQEVLHAAGLPLIRVPARASYGAVEAEEVVRRLGFEPAAAQAQPVRREAPEEAAFRPVIDAAPHSVRPYAPPPPPPPRPN